MAELKGLKAKSASERCNKTAIMCHTIESLIISLAYVMEVVKKSRTVGYVAFIVLVAMIPVILEWMYYQKNKENKSIRYIVSIGFSVLYAAVMLTTNNIVAFIYIIPMMFALTVYSDFMYMVLLVVASNIINIIEVVIMLNNGYYTSDDTAKIEIQILGVLLMGIYAIYSTKISSDIAKERVTNVVDQQEQIEDVLQTVKHVAEEITGRVSAVKEKTTDLSNALIDTKDAMTEVNAGAMDTAEAVQEQLTQTSEIQGYVADVDSESRNIINSVELTIKAIEKGKENIERLTTQVNNSVSLGSSVRSQLEELNNDMKNMTSIIDIITEITNQTSLLALNASIEAARAGEAGKGFAVVATEITHMSDQTQNATVKINETINKVSESIGKVIEATGNIIAMIQEQEEATLETANGFTSIKDNTDNVSAKVVVLQKYVDKLNTSNRAIVDSISTVSSISEEVSAQATETLNTSESNTVIIDSVISNMNELGRLSDELRDKLLQ